MHRPMALPAGLRPTDLLAGDAGVVAGRPASPRHKERRQLVIPTPKKADPPTMRSRARQAGRESRAYPWKACRRTRAYLVCVPTAATVTVAPRATAAGRTVSSAVSAESGLKRPPAPPHKTGRRRSGGRGSTTLATGGRATRARRGRSWRVPARHSGSRKARNHASGALGHRTAGIGPIGLAVHAAPAHGNDTKEEAGTHRKRSLSRSSTPLNRWLIGVSRMLPTRPVAATLAASIGRLSNAQLPTRKAGSRCQRSMFCGARGWTPNFPISARRERQ